MRLLSVRQIEFVSYIVPFTLSQLGAASNLKPSRLRSEVGWLVGSDGCLPGFSDFPIYFSGTEQGSFIPGMRDMRRMKISRDFSYEKAHTVV
jgi:hypothetical protein